MSVFLEFLHTALAIVYLAYVYARVRHLARLTLLHFTSSFFVASVYLFFPLVRYDQWAIVTPSTAGCSLSFFVVLVFACVAADLLLYRRLATLPRRLPTRLSVFALWGLFLFGAVGFLRFYFIGGAVEHFGEVVRAVMAGGDYYQARIAVATDMDRSTGLGVAHSEMAVNGVFPVVIAVLLAWKHRQGGALRATGIAGCMILSLAIVSINLKREAVLSVLLLPVVSWWVLRRPQAAERRLLQCVSGRGLAAVIIVCIGVGAGAYAWTDSSSMSVALYSGFERVFLAPSMVSSWYFSAFPDVFPFRGWTELFFLPSDAMGPGVSTRDIARYATTYYAMNANTNFIATAYTASGASTALAAIGIIVAILVVADKSIEQFGSEARALNILINFAGVITLPNLPLGVALSTGGFVYPTLLLWGVLATTRRQRKTSGGTVIETTGSAS